MTREWSVGNHRGRLIALSDDATVGETHGAETSLGWYRLVQTNSGRRLNQCCTFLWTFLLRKVSQEYLLYLVLQEVPVAETSQRQRQFPFYRMMNELICVKVWSLCLSIHTWKTLMRVYWSCFNQASLIYLCLKAAVVRSLWSLRYCWPQQGLSQSGPSLFSFFFFSPPQKGLSTL